MEISLSTGLYYKKNYIEILDIIAQSGFGNIELFVNQAFMEVEHKDIKKAIDQRRLKVSSIHAGIRLFTDKETDEIELVEECMVLGKLLDTKHIVTHDIFERDSQGKVYFDDRNHYRAMSHLKNDDFIIMTENMPHKVGPSSKMGDMNYMYEFIKKNNYPITLDITHAATAGDDIIEAYELLKPCIRNIHLSDYKDGSEHKILGSGDLPIDEFLQHLKDDNYEHLLTVEYDFDNLSRNVITSDEEAIEALRQTFNYLNKIL